MSWKQILAAAAVAVLVAACGGDKDPSRGNGGASASDTTSPDTSGEASDSAVTETSPPVDYIGQPEPSFSADDNHPQTQWKSRMFASLPAGD